MRGARSAEQVLHFTTASSNAARPFICRSCQLHQTRQFHSSPALLAGSDQPWWKKLTDNVFGGKEKDARTEELRVTSNREKATAGEKGVRETFKAPDGTVYEYAQPYDEKVNTTYQPAKTWEDLDRVGDARWVKRRHDQGERYKGYRSGTKGVLLDTAQWKKVVHHVAVEALLLKKHNLPLARLCQKSTSGDHRDSWNITTQAKIEADHLGNLSVTLPQASHEQDILAAIGRGPPKDLAQDSGAGNVSLSVPVKDSLVKFAITQRVLQLTAHRISDSAVSRAKTLHDLCAAYRKTEAPKKLAQEPKVQKMKVELANVTWHDSKRTMIQKEKDVGRWKIIEEALADANLPSTGSRWKQARTHIR